jgi:xanthine dehydrogenase accessory factor
VPFCLATVVRVEAPTSAKPGDKAVITADSTMTGWIGGSCSQDSIKREALASLEEGMPRLVRIEPTASAPLSPAGDAPLSRAGEVVLGTSCPSGGTLEIFLEPQRARPQLVVIGHSPAARTLIRLAAHVGFRTCGAHPGAADADFPGADLILPHLELSAAGVGGDSWIVVATMGHYDEEALEAALHTNAAYVGLIASRRRRNAVVGVLRRRGWSGDALAGIVNPAGRMLGDTQEEIALSVLADIVDRRHRRQTRTVAAIETPAVLFATDPICGMSVEIAAARYVRDGVYFCSQGCLEAYGAQAEISVPGSQDVVTE